MSSLTPKPKVIAAVVGGIIASAILSNITLITPDLFSGLGKASGLVYGLTITLVIGVCGWLKSDGEPADTSKDAAPADAPATGTGWQGDGHGVAHDSVPVSTFPAADVAAAVAAAEPLAPAEPVTPVYAPPAPTTIA